MSVFTPSSTGKGSSRAEITAAVASAATLIVSGLKMAGVEVPPTDVVMQAQLLAVLVAQFFIRRAQGASKRSFHP
jgi:hypothetical protein